VIRFSVIVSVVAIALGLLIAGAVSGTLMVVYLAIGVASLALLLLIAGVVIWRDEVFGSPAGQDACGGTERLVTAEEPVPAGARMSPAAMATEALAASVGGPARPVRPARSPEPAYSGAGRGRSDRDGERQDIPADRPAREDLSLDRPRREDRAGRPPGSHRERPLDADRQRSADRQGGGRI